MPDDLSIVGFDDIPLAADLAPPLTTVRQDPTAVGRAAADSLLLLLEGWPVGPVVALPEPRLVVRSSTAPPH